MQKIAPLKQQIKKNDSRIIGAFDIETTPSDQSRPETALFGDFADGFLKYEDDESFYRATSIAELVDRILSREDVILYAHNFKGYESNYILDELVERNISFELVIQGDNGVIGMLLPHDIEIRDSLALIPMSLKAATKAFKTKQKGDIGLGEGEIYDKENTLHQEYCKNDVACTIEIVKRLIELTYDTFGCGIGWTSASTALACWKTTIPPGHSYWRMSHYLEEFCRFGYYGGFVYPGHDIHVHKNVTSIDRNAAYAAAMREGVPKGKPCYTTTYEEGKSGIYEVKVKTARPDIVCIPCRRKGALLWPTGAFETVVTNLEIDFATRHGYEIEIVEGLYWEEDEHPFDEFIARCERIETEEPDKKPSVKLNRNGLYGKFGSKFFTQEVRVIDAIPEEEEGWVPLTDPRTGEVNIRAFTREKQNDANYILPHWAAFITARERIWMFETMLAVGMEHVRYGDTDSVKADTKAVERALGDGCIQIGSEYGQCKIDEEYSWFQCLGPKVYHGELISGKSKMRAKGIPMRGLDEKKFERAYHSTFDEISFVSSNGTMTRLKNRKLPLQKDIGRRLTNIRESESWVVSEDGLIHPPHLTTS